MPDHSGVYRTPADPAALQDLRDRAAASGAAWIEADLAAVRDKGALLETLARAGAFPSSFGGNWDALADSLQDLSWRPAESYVLRLRTAGYARRAIGAEWPTFVDILRETAEFWNVRGKPFIVLVDGAGELPAWK